MNSKTLRDEYYDIVKGIVAINIIVIHTVFWLGTSYVPNQIQKFILLLDVPCFFFCSGACQHYVMNVQRQFKSLGKLYLKWIQLLLIYSSLAMISGGT